MKAHPAIALYISILLFLASYAVTKWAEQEEAAAAADPSYGSSYLNSAKKHREGAFACANVGFFVFCVWGILLCCTTDQLFAVKAYTVSGSRDLDLQMNEDWMKSGYAGLVTPPKV